VYRGTGINVFQQPFDNLQIGDTFFDADYGEVIWNGSKWQINDLTKRASYIEGELVTFIPYSDCVKELWENGIVKAVTPTGIRVVYHVGEGWSSYRDYTSALTSIAQLRRGWIINIKIKENDTYL